MRHGWIAGAALIATLAGPGIAAAAPDDGPIAASVARLLETEEIRVVEPSAPGGAAAGALAVRQQPPRRIRNAERSKGATHRAPDRGGRGRRGGRRVRGRLPRRHDRRRLRRVRRPRLQGLPDRLPGRRRRRRRAGRPLPVPVGAGSGRTEAADAVDQPIDLALGRVAGAAGADQAARARASAGPPRSMRRSRRATRRRRAPPGARRRHRHRGRRR